MQEALLYLGLDNVCLLGDFNARTGSLSDTIIESAHVDKASFAEDICCIPPRCSKDLSTNNFGYELIDLCKTCELVIANGRMGSDAGIGKLTCKSSSVVDYVVISQSIFKLVNNFSVLDFDEMCSDIHCPIVVTFPRLSEMNNSKNFNQDSPCNNIIGPRPKWNIDLKQQFIEGIEDEEVSKYVLVLERLIENSDLVDLVQINVITEQVSKIMTNSAERLNMLKESHMEVRSRPRQASKASHKP